MDRTGSPAPALTLAPGRPRPTGSVGPFPSSPCSSSTPNGSGGPRRTGRPRRYRWVGGGARFLAGKGLCRKKTCKVFYDIFSSSKDSYENSLPRIFPNELESCGRAPPLCMFPLRTIKKIPQGMINNHSLGNTRIDTRVSYAHTDHQACFRLKLNR